MGFYARQVYFFVFCKPLQCTKRTQNNSKHHPDIYLENTGTAIKQSDWLSLVIGSGYPSCVIKCGIAVLKSYECLCGSSTRSISGGQMDGEVIEHVKFDGFTQFSVLNSQFELRTALCQECI